MILLLHWSTLNYAGLVKVPLLALQYCDALLAKGADVPQRIFLEN